MRKEIYFSVDVETDGPIPGPYSMLSLGCSIAGYKTSDGTIVKLNPDLPENQFYVELAPISDKFIPEALNVSGLDRDGLKVDGVAPSVGLTDFCEWVNNSVARLEGISAVFAAYPLGFDWLFTYWYIVQFSKIASPFSHGRHLDMKTEYSAKSGALISGSVKRNMPRALFSTRPHTHNALDDAIEQGEFLMNLLNTPGGKEWPHPVK